MKSVAKRALGSPVFITTIAYLVRLAVLFYGWRYGQVPVQDHIPFGFETGQVARSIAAGRGFASPLRDFITGPTAWFVPIYPYLLAGIFKLWGIYSDTSHMVISIINCAFAALTVIPIHSIAKRNFGNVVAACAAWTWVFLPSAILYPVNWVWDTAMAGLFFALIFWATLAMRERRDVLAWTGYGLLWAIGVSINPSLMSTLPLFFGWLVWHLRKESPNWLKPAAAATLIFALALVPWTVRNYRVFHKVIVLRSNFGLELWLGNNPEVAIDWSPWLHPNESSVEGLKYQAEGEIAYMEEKEDQAVAFMQTHPMETMGFMFHRFVEYWLNFSDNPADTWSSSPLRVKALTIMNCLLALSCLFGALLLNRAQAPEGFVYASVLLAFPLVFYLTHTSARYRYPADPIMIVLSVNGIAHLISILRTIGSRRLSPSGQPRSLPTNS